MKDIDGDPNDWTCPDCKGEGYIYRFMAQTTECKRCKGTGYRPDDKAALEAWFVSHPTNHFTVYFCRLSLDLGWVGRERYGESWEPLFVVRKLDTKEFIHTMIGTYTRQELAGGTLIRWLLGSSAWDSGGQEGPAIGNTGDWCGGFDGVCDGSCERAEDRWRSQMGMIIVDLGRGAEARKLYNEAVDYATGFARAAEQQAEALGDP